MVTTKKFFPPLQPLHTMSRWPWRLQSTKTFCLSWFLLDMIECPKNTITEPWKWFANLSWGVYNGGRKCPIFLVCPHLNGNVQESPSDISRNDTNSHSSFRRKLRRTTRESFPLLLALESSDLLMNSTIGNCLETQPFWRRIDVGNVADQYMTSSHLLLKCPCARRIAGMRKNKFKCNGYRCDAAGS